MYGFVDGDLSHTLSIASFIVRRGLWHSGNDVFAPFNVGYPKLEIRSTRHLSSWSGVLCTRLVTTSVGVVAGGRRTTASRRKSHRETSTSEWQNRTAKLPTSYAKLVQFSKAIGCGIKHETPNIA